MAINIRKKIGNSIGAAGARQGKSLEATLAAQEKRGGVSDNDREWIRDGYIAAKGWTVVAHESPTCCICRTHDAEVDQNTCAFCESEAEVA